MSTDNESKRRDMFAAAALQGILAADVGSEGEYYCWPLSNDQDRNKLASQAWKIADAMIRCESGIEEEKSE